MTVLLQLVRTVNACLSDYVLTFLLIGIGVWTSIQTDFVQIRYLKAGVKRVFHTLSRRGETYEDGVNAFEALSTAVTPQMGAGTIVGAGGAILVGGPGAIFWMWVAAFFGMATAYAETVVSIQTRRKPHAGRFQAGPVHYIQTAFDGLLGERLAGFFAVAAALSLGFVGAMVQSNAVSAAFRTAFGVPAWATGLLLSGACGAVFLGGAKRLRAVAARLVPVAELAFLCGGVIVLLTRIAYLPSAFWMIFKYAFTPGAIIGGGAGAAMKTAVSQGAKRGLLANEAGLGSAPHAHAQANVDRPHDQGIVAMTGVFFDSFILLTLNALVILSTLYVGGGPLAHGYVGAALETLNRANLTQTAFGTVFGGGFGGAFVAACLLCLTFPAILYWNDYGRVNMVYLFGRDSNVAYSVAALAFLFLGTLASSDLVWELSDLFNQWMVLPNAFALFCLTGFVYRAVRQADRDNPRRRRYSRTRERQ